MSYLRGPSAKAEVITLLAVLSLLLALSPIPAFSADLQGTTEPGSIGDCGAYNDHQWTQGMNFSSNFDLTNITLNITNGGGAATAYVGLKNGSGWIESSSLAISGGFTLYNFTFSGTKRILANSAPNSYNVTLNYSRSAPVDIKVACNNPSSPNYPGGQLWSESQGYATGDMQAEVWGTTAGAVAPDPVVYLGNNPVNAYNTSSTSVTFDAKASQQYNISCIAIYGNWSGGWNSKSQLCGVSNDTWYNLTATGIPAGYYVWTAWANSTNSTFAFNGTNRTLTVDNVAPQVSVSFPANNSFMNANTQNLSVYASDNFKVGNVTVYGNWSSSTYCQQETANISTPCGGLSTGKYDDGNLSSIYSSQWRDGDYLTYTSLSVGETRRMFVNYTVPISSHVDIWQTAIGFPAPTLENWTVPSYCSEASFKAQIELQNQAGAGNVCYAIGTCLLDNSSKVTIFNKTAAGVGCVNNIIFYEESVFFIPNTITSPTNNTNSTFNITGLPDSTYQFYSVSCDFLDNCNATSNYTFTVDTLTPNITSFNTTPTINSYLSNTSAVYFNATVTDANLASVWLQLGNGTNYTATPGTGGAYYVYFGSLKVGSYNTTWWANDSAGNRANSTNQSFQVVVPFLGLCGGVSNTTALNFTFYDEDNLHPKNLTLEWNGSISSFGIPISTNGSEAGKHEVDLCILPADATVYATMLFNYYNASYVTRQYYIYNASLTAATNQIYLYGLPISAETNVTVTVTDASGVPVGDVIIKFLRYYVPTNTYRTVAMAKTYSGNGIAANVHLLTNNVWYRIILEKDGVVLNTFEPVTITGNTLTLKTSAGNYGDYWTYYSTVYAHCSTSNETLTVSCTLADSTGIGTSSHFLVVKSGALTNTTICDTTSAGVNGVAFVCNLGNTTNTDYWYTVQATVSGNEVTIASGSVSTPASPQFGIYGLVLTALLVIGVASVGSFSPAAAIVLAVLGVVISSVTQLAIIPTGALVGLAVVAGFAVFKMRT